MLLLCSGRWVAAVITLRRGCVTMKLQKSCVLVLGLLLGAGLIGCVEKPGLAAEKDARPTEHLQTYRSCWPVLTAFLMVLTLS